MMRLRVGAVALAHLQRLTCKQTQGYSNVFTFEANKRYSGTADGHHVPMPGATPFETF